MSICCIYPWTCLTIHDNTQIGSCCNTNQKITYKDGMTKWDIINHPIMQNFRKSMVEGTTCQNGYCSPNCEYMIGNDTRLEKFKDKLSPETYEEISQGKTIIKTAPEIVILHVSNECNYNCVMCPEKTLEPDYELSPKLLEIVKEIAELNQSTRLIWLGGEPTYSEQTKLKLKELSKTHKFRVYLLTNGSIFDENLLDNIHVENVTISIDSINPEKYKKIRIGGNLDNVLMNLEKYINYRGNKKGFDIGIISVVLKENYKDLSEIIKTFSTKEIDLTFQLGRNCNKELNIAYLSQIDNILKRDILQSISDAEKLKNYIDSYPRPELIKTSLIVLREHIVNYQINDHSHIKNLRRGVL